MNYLEGSHPKVISSDTSKSNSNFICYPNTCKFSCHNLILYVKDEQGLSERSPKWKKEIAWTQ